MTTTKSPRILLVVTSHDQMGTGPDKTGFWLEELAAPFNAFVEAGATVDIASPRGGKPPADPKSEKDPGEAVQAFLANKEAVAKLNATKEVASVREPYDAYFVVGGHGAMFDLATHEATIKLLGNAFDEGRVVAAVCHGVAALVNVKTKNGESIVKGRRVAGFSDEEERAVKLDGIMPFPLETRLRELGGKYERGAMWQSFVARDGKLVTGQNPRSSAAAAKETLEALNT